MRYETRLAFCQGQMYLDLVFAGGHVIPVEMVDSSGW